MSSVTACRKSQSALWQMDGVECGLATIEVASAQASDAPDLTMDARIRDEGITRPGRW
jgi:hypothetical protein